MIDVTFLVADDSKSLRVAIRDVIENRLGGKNVIYEAANGLDSLEILKVHPVDIIISDWHMPGMSGEELLFEVRHNEKWKDIPFLMITSIKDKDNVVTAIQLGVTHYLTKPFTADELEDKLRKSWSNSARRKDKRYSSAYHNVATVLVNNVKYKGEILNVSSSGTLLNLKYQETFKLFREYEVSMQFEKSAFYDTTIIGPLVGVIIRLESDSTSEKTQSCMMALRFNNASTDPKILARLDALLRAISDKETKTIDGP